MKDGRIPARKRAGRPARSAGRSEGGKRPTMREPSEPVPGTGKRRKGGADRRHRVKHGAADPDPKLGKITSQHGEAKRRRANRRSTT